MRKFKKCKYCDREAKRNVRLDGRNKGHYRTCGGKECLMASYKDPNVIKKKIRIGSDNPNWLGDRRLLKRPRTSFEGNKWRKAVY